MGLRLPEVPEIPKPVTPEDIRRLNSINNAIADAMLLSRIVSDTNERLRKGLQASIYEVVTVHLPGELPPRIVTRFMEHYAQHWKVTPVYRDRNKNPDYFNFQLPPEQASQGPYR